jgi:hypothetical protein
MALWIEIRCDARRAGCYSDQNNGPMGASGNRRGPLVKTVAMLEREAERDGWLRTRTGMLCPSCREIKNGQVVL